MKDCLNKDMRKMEYRDRLIGEYAAAKSKLDQGENIEIFFGEMDRFLEELRGLVDEHFPAFQKEACFG